MYRAHHAPLSGHCSAAIDPMEELTAIYLAAANQDVINLDRALADAERDPGCWSVVVEEMREIVHNVKGQGTSFGYPLMTQVGDSLSALLKAADACDAMILKLAAAHIQAMRLILSQDIKGDGGEQGAALVERLSDLVEGQVRS